MACQHVTMPGGGTAIVCSSHRRQRCACGRNATLLCDWRVPGKKSGTCDEPICRWCTTSPAKDKDLCRDHAAAYTKWLASRPSQQAGQ